ncbi:FAD binding domain-containing protein [Specibacter cremeus]|uniref:FAD binding domain-containing protein n=1 Tax=Specibacter cremeus TaxID=1629051 RepID=UPI000F78EFBD|nr:xanthine dehydrogenase family protein subunit M [Specibacter cremeus]
MKAFAYAKAPDLAAALAAIEDPGTSVIAGGTEMVNWLKEGIATPERLVDINGLPLDGIDARPEGLRLGALARMSDAAPVVAAEYPVLAESLLCAASPQLRNMASLGGNLLQRTRCPYFRAEVLLPCNKRAPGSGCAARHGETRTQAIFGWSDACVATHPSDFAVALAALDATVIIVGPRGERTVPVTGFYRLPGDDPTVETVLAPDELVTAIDVPAGPHTRASHYLKVRERASYEFAMVAVAAALAHDGGVVTDARLALGGVAARPWRLDRTEAALRGVSLDDTEALRAAVAASFAEARPLAGNAFKVKLAQRATLRALTTAGSRGMVAS